MEEQVNIPALPLVFNGVTLSGVECVLLDMSVGF